MLTSGSFNKKDHFIRYRNEKKEDLTFILGARCSDGIVMIGDRKMTRSQGSSTYEDKLFAEIEHVVLGAAGVVGLYDKFRKQIYDIAKDKKTITPTDFINESETIAFELNKKYNERTRGGRIELLIGYGKTRRGSLQYVTPNGLGEEVRSYKIIGSGEPYGEYFLRKLWKSEMNMREVAILGTCIIKIIEESELDDSVGVKHKAPQIWFIPDWGEDIEYNVLNDDEKLKLATREASGNELTDIMSEANQLYRQIDEIFNKIAIANHDEKTT